MSQHPEETPSLTEGQKLNNLHFTATKLTVRVMVQSEGAACGFLTDLVLAQPLSATQTGN